MEVGNNPSSRVTWTATENTCMHAHLARHQITSRTARWLFLNEILDALNCTAFGPEYERIATPRIVSSLLYKLRRLVADGVLVRDPILGVEIWPEWTRAWALHGWDGDTSAPEEEEVMGRQQQQQQQVRPSPPESQVPSSSFIPMYPAMIPDLVVDDTLMARLFAKCLQLGRRGSQQQPNHPANHRLPTTHDNGLSTMMTTEAFKGSMHDIALGNKYKTDCLDGDGDVPIPDAVDDDAYDECQWVGEQSMQEEEKEDEDHGQARAKGKGKADSKRLLLSKLHHNDNDRDKKKSITSSNRLSSLVKKMKRMPPDARAQLVTPCPRDTGPSSGPLNTAKKLEEMTMGGVGEERGGGDMLGVDRMEIDRHQQGFQREAAFQAQAQAQAHNQALQQHHQQYHHQHLVNNVPNNANIDFLAQLHQLQGQQGHEVHGHATWSAGTTLVSCPKPTSPVVAAAHASTSAPAHDPEIEIRHVFASAAQQNQGTYTPVH